MTTSTRKRKTIDKDAPAKKMKMSKKERKRKRESKKEKETKSRKRSKKTEKANKVKKRVATPLPEKKEKILVAPSCTDLEEFEETVFTKSNPKKTKPKKNTLMQKVTFTEETPNIIPEIVLPEMPQKMQAPLLSRMPSLSSKSIPTASLPPMPPLSSVPMPSAPLSTTLASLQAENDLEPQEDMEQKKESKEEFDGFQEFFISIWIAFMSQLLTLYDFDDVYTSKITAWFGHLTGFFTIFNVCCYTIIFLITRRLFKDTSRQITTIRCLHGFCFLFPSLILNFYPTSTAIFNHTSVRLVCLFFGYIIAEQLFVLLISPDKLNEAEPNFYLMKNIVVLVAAILVGFQFGFDLMVQFTMVLGLQMNIVYIILFAIFHLEWSYEFEVASTIACFVSTFGRAIPERFYDAQWNTFLNFLFEKYHEAF